MSDDLWLGVAFSIPVGLAINLATPLVARRIEQRNKRSADKRAQRDAEFKQKAEELAKDSGTLYVYLLETLVRVAYIGALFGVLSGTMFLLTNSSVGMDFGRLQRVFTAATGSVGQLFALMGALMILNITRVAVQTVREVRTVSSSAE